MHTTTTTATTLKSADRGSPFNAPSSAFIPTQYETTPQRSTGSSQSQIARALAATAPATSSLPSECFFG